MGIPSEKQLGSEKWSLSKDQTRIYIGDTGASYHLVDLNNLSPEEKLTVRKLEEAIYLQTANGTIEAEYSATVYVKELDISVTAILLPLSIITREALRRERL